MPRPFYRRGILRFRIPIPIPARLRPALSGLSPGAAACNTIARGSDWVAFLIGPALMTLIEVAV